VHGAVTPQSRSKALVAWPILFLSGLVLAACSSSPAATTSPPQHSSTTSSTAASSSTTSSTVPTTGPLQAGSPIATPLSATQVVAAEGPNGAVFVASQDPTNPTPAIVWVIDGQGPAAVAEHTQIGVAALAADPANLYVATYNDVTAYDRNTGNQSGHWNLPAITTSAASNEDLVALAASGGRVYVSITQGNTVTVYRINPTSSAKPAAEVQGLGDAIGPNGTIYYERNDHHLVALAQSGATTTGPALADTPNGLGGGVQYLDTFAGNAVWVDEPAGQGLDEQWTTYDATTLAQVGTFHGTEGESFVDTAAGVLVLASPDVSSGCVQGTSQAGTWCVSRVSLTGAMSDPLPFPNAIDLVGPQPVVIGQNSSNTAVEIIRLG
jgi:hypothetical protein